MDVCGRGCAAASRAENSKVIDISRCALEKAWALVEPMDRGNRYTNRGRGCMGTGAGVRESRRPVYNVMQLWEYVERCACSDGEAIGPRRSTHAGVFANGIRQDLSNVALERGEGRLKVSVSWQSGWDVRIGRLSSRKRARFQGRAHDLQSFKR